MTTAVEIGDDAMPEPVTSAPTDDVIGGDPPGMAVPLRRVIALVAVACFFGGAVAYFLSTPRPPGADSVDVGFYRDMTVHHDQGVELASIELANGSNSTVKGFAREIILAQRWELGRMYQQLTEWGASVAPTDTAMDWMGMPVPTGSMPGLATAEELQALGDATGTEADTLFLELMAEHHRGAIHMATYAAQNAEDADVRGLASVMARNQAIEINEFIQTAERFGLDVDIEPAEIP